MQRQLRTPHIHTHLHCSSIRWIGVIILPQRNAGLWPITPIIDNILPYYYTITTLSTIDCGDDGGVLLQQQCLPPRLFCFKGKRY